MPTAPPPAADSVVDLLRRAAAVAARRGTRRPPGARRRGGGPPRGAGRAPGRSRLRIAQDDSDSHLLLRSPPVLSRIVLLCVGLAAVARSGLRLRRRSSAGRHGRRGLLSPRVRRRAGRRRRTSTCREPDAARRRAARPRADRARRRARRDAALVVYLGDGFQPAVEDAVDGARAGRPLDVLDDATPAACPRRARPARLARPGPLRRDRRARSPGARRRPPPRTPSSRRLDALDVEYRRGLARCERREIVTSHAAFGYLAARYGLEQVPLVGLAPEAEPTPRDARAPRRRGARDAARRRSSSSRSSRPARRRRSRARPASTTAVLDPLEGLTADELDAGADYFTVMRAEPRRSCGRRSDARSTTRRPPRARRRLVRLPRRAAGARGRLARPSSRASSSASPGRTAAARRRCCGSCSGSSGPPSGACASSARLPAARGARRGSATSPSGHSSPRRRPVTVREVV